MNQYEHEEFNKNRYLHLISAIIGTIIWTSLFPFSFVLIIVTAMSFDTPWLPNVLQMAVLILSFCVSLSCIAAIASIWISYYKKKVKNIYLSNLIPVAMLLFTVLFDIILYYLFS